MSTIRRRHLVFGLLLGASGCDIAGSAGPQRVDAEWHRRALVDGHLSKWLAVAPTPSGLFVTSFDRRWAPRPRKGTHLTAQCRLVYAMACGFELTQDRRYLDTATRGADFLLNHFHDPVHGGFFTAVDVDGKVVADAKQTYGHAFALFALSHMFRVSRDERFKSAALQTWREIDGRLREANGGLLGTAARDFSPKDAGRSQNPVMHMFEALLALVDATGDADALAGATSVGNFVLYQLLQGTADGGAHVPEWYDESWKPLPTKEKGGYIDLGHQFEWAHMLLTSDRHGLPGIISAASDRFLQYALKVGYDEEHGGTFSTCYPDGSVARNKYWWPQAECLRALVTAAARTDRADLWQRYAQTLTLIREEFIDADNGGWHNASRQQCASKACPDEQPDPYHMTGMHLAALQVAGDRASG